MNISAKTIPLSLASLLFGVGCLASSAAAEGPLQLVPKASQPAAQPVAKTPAAALDTATAVHRADQYLNTTTNFSADFVQIGADGSRTQGELYVQKPGRMHFEYDPPAKLEILADGTSVAVRDKKLNTQDLYFIGQTPLKFLLKDHIDLARDTRVIKVTAEGNSTSILIEDKATFGGTSHIKLTFDSSTFALKQWKVIDPQGYDTLVTLFNVNTKSKPDPKLFTITQKPRE